MLLADLRARVAALPNAVLAIAAVIVAGVAVKVAVERPFRVSPQPEVANPSNDEQPPALPLSVYRPVSRESALRINAASFAVDPGPSARPFNIVPGVALTRATTCLATAIYYEAASESDEGQRAVAQVVINRVRHPAFPNSVCAVVYQGAERSTGCQFTFVCDGSLRRAPSRWGLASARRIAAAALSGNVYQPVGLATHYHANWVVPYWASTLIKSATVGAHLFYRWNGWWGQPSAFRQRYASIEPQVSELLDDQPGGAGVSVEVDPAVSVGTADVSSIAPPDLLADVGRIKIADAPKPLADVQSGVLIPELNVTPRPLADARAIHEPLNGERTLVGVSK